MWIKRLLVIVPIATLVFLVQAIFWVPGTDTAAQNESRQDRLILYMGANPEDMNTWTSTKTNDSTISDYIFEGLLRTNHNYETEPWLADPVTVQHQMTLRVPDGATADTLKAQLGKLYGDKLKSCEITSPAEEIRIDYASGKTLDKVAEGQEVFTFTQPAEVKILLAPKPVKGRIESAVEPEFEAVLEKWLGHAPFASLNADALAKRALEAAPAGLKEKIKEDTLKKSFAAILEAMGPVIKHAPIVDMQIQHGIHWIDGPFFNKADLKDPETGKERRHFGDDAGPWWCEGPEIMARDAKLTYDYLRDADFNSPRRSSYMSIEETRIFKDDPYHFQVVYGELYSPALGDLTGALLPYHVWNRQAWTAEAIRKGKGPKDVGVPEDPKLGQWDAVPPGVYKPHRFLPSREREFSMKPSTMGFMVIEPLNGTALPLWNNGLRCRLRRNEFYWDRKPEYKFIDYYVFDPALGRETTEVVFNSGGTDYYGAKDYQADRYKELGDQYTIIQRQPNTYEYLAFNCQKDQLKDRNVRLALSMAINVEDIIKYVAYNQGSRINGPAYPVLPWYNHDHMITHTWRTDGKDKDGKTISRKGKTEKIKYLPYDTEEAKAILAEAGYQDVNGKLMKGDKPLHISFINSSGGGARKNTALLAKEQWTKLGVDVDYKEYEWNVFIQQYVMALNFDVCVLGWSGGIDFDSRQLWASDQFPTDGGLNLAAYSNPKADKLMNDILKIYDYDAQVKMSHEIFDTIADDFPYVFLYSPYATYVFDKHIIWRKQVGKDKSGNPILEDRPFTNDYIMKARANIKYFFGELKRVEDVPDFKPQDYKR